MNTVTGLSKPDASGSKLVTQVGLIVVHGIGEQGRFEHLDRHVRGIIQGIRRAGARVSVEIMGSSAASFQAVQDTWQAGPYPAIRLIVRRPNCKCDLHINVHEVWWADVNERYSVMKQVRFWIWGLSIWSYPRRFRIKLPTAESMFPPRDENPKRKAFAVRARLFGIGCFFLMSSLTVGIGSVLLKRLLNLEPFDVVKTFANYISSVKLYNQPHRGGSGFSGSGADFLDTLGEPPRTSIRRRMIRTIADVALRNYDRWYILAHSQGSVVAFNALMEPAFGWTGYLDERRWLRLVAQGMAGVATTEPANMDASVPARALWAKSRAFVKRPMVFGKFHGLLTYGNPMEKFAAIWPASVPVCREAAFKPNTVWLNAYDPLDAVSGVMRSWPTADPAYCPRPQTVGYAAGSVLLWGHLKYLDCPDYAGTRLPAPNKLRLADGVARWLIDDDASAITKASGEKFFQIDSIRASTRRFSAWLQWLAFFAGATVLAAAIVPPVLSIIAKASILTMPSWLQADIRECLIWHWLHAAAKMSLFQRAAILVVLVAIATLVVGITFNIRSLLAPAMKEQCPIKFTGIESPKEAASVASRCGQPSEGPPRC